MTKAETQPKREPVKFALDADVFAELEQWAHEETREHFQQVEFLVLQAMKERRAKAHAAAVAKPAHVCPPCTRTHQDAFPWRFGGEAIVGTATDKQMIWNGSDVSPLRVGESVAPLTFGMGADSA